MALSRSEIEKIVNRGESVVWNGRVIRNREDIPSATELAGDDPLHRAAAVKDLEEQVKKLQAQLDEAKSGPKVDNVKDAEEKPDGGSKGKKSNPEPPGKDVK